MRAWRPASVGYVFGLLADVARFAFIMLASVEVIFLSDLVIAHLLPRVLEHRAGILNLMLLVALAIPEALYIALPLAVLVAVYLVVLRRKEANELAVIAGMGYSGRIVVLGALGIGTMSAALTIFLSGYVEPHTNYLMEKAFRSIGYTALRDGEIGAGKVYEAGDYAVFAAGGRLNEVADKLFINQRIDDGHTRAIVASRSLGLDSGGSKVGIVLRDAQIVEFRVSQVTAAGQTADAGADCKDCALRLSPLRMSKVNQAFSPMPNLQLPDLDPPREAPHHRTTFELLAGDTSGYDVTRVLADRLLQAVLCFLAPLLAVLAMALTRQKSALIALPGAAAAVLAVSFFGSDLVKLLAPFGFVPAASVITAGTAVVALVTAWLIRRFESGCFAPAGVRL